jgi:hypothetical protein
MFMLTIARKCFFPHLIEFHGTGDQKSLPAKAHEAPPSSEGSHASVQRQKPNTSHQRFADVTRPECRLDRERGLGLPDLSREVKVSIQWHEANVTE